MDVAIYLLLIFAGVPHLGARAMSYVPAASFNWSINRIMTFNHRPRRPKMAQWSQFMVVSAVGFFFNWGTYALLTHFIPFFDEQRLLALLAGVVVGTGFNFVFSDLLVFRAASATDKTDNK